VKIRRRLSHRSPSDLIRSGSLGLSAHWGWRWLLPWGVISLAGCTQAADWWAFTPPRSAPAGAGVDAFVEAALAAKGLERAAAADRRTLLRRASLTLTGLLPTAEAVRAFENDARPDAWARVLDELLASPHLGEQWARHWLDVARYSDTKGYVYAREERRWVHAAGYRDWVVRALNEDMPYDRFLQLQIAADQLVPAGSPDLAAMGFLTLGRRFLGVTHDIIDDRIDVVTRATLGLSVACARCHDHKYDPIPTRDYYALYGVFQSCAEAVVPAGEAGSEGLAAESAELLEKLRNTMTTRREEAMARLRASVAEHLLAQLELEKYPEEVFGQLLEAEDLNPVFVHRWQAWLAEDAQQERPLFTRWHEALKLGDEAAIKESATHYGAELRGIEQKWQQLLAADPQARALPDAEEERLRQVLHGPRSPCVIPDEHIANIEMLFPNKVVTELWKLQGAVDRWLLDHPEATPHATVLVDRATPVTPRVFLRGNPLTKGEQVERRFLEVLGGSDQQAFTQGSGRRELAEAIASPANPLTARVMVNRVWALVFGQGLVPTPSDFGVRSELPSHPELLDWLALRFMESGWSVKHLLRTLMLSRCYQQNARGPADAAALARAQEIDPENRLLWRMNGQRLRFETARDAWLAAADGLDLSLGGPPLELFAPQHRRRTLYTLIDREKLPAVLSTFDFANPDLSIPQRSETTVPQQALFGLNHPFVRQCAVALSAALSGDEAARVQDLYARLFQRRPSEKERTTALAFVRDQPPEVVEGSGAEAWQYGYGEFDAETGRLKEFNPLPHFVDGAWRGGATWPDKKLGWVQLTAAGGHPGNDWRHAVVRRWTAPTAGSYALRSVLVHEPKAGDGIRAFVSHGRRGLLQSATVHSRSERLDLAALSLDQGDTLDFIVDIGGGLNNDQFLWAPRLTLQSSTGSGGDALSLTWDATKDFTGAGISRLTPWQQLVQVLLLSNEFWFID
jgi:hypothetical protein